MGAGVAKSRKRLGAWLVREKNTIYQAATDGYVAAYAEINGFDLKALTDSSTPPTIVRAWEFDSSSDGAKGAVSMFVRKGDYWEIITTNAFYAVFWIPLEP